MKIKSICCLLLVGILLLALCGCSQGPTAVIADNGIYAVKEADGEFFLDFHDSSYEEEAKRQIEEQKDSGVNLSTPVSVLSFSSLKKMKETVEKGQFSKEQLITMQKWFRKTSNGNIAVCNTEDLYDVLLPEGVRLQGISWFGYGYSFSFATDPAGSSGSIRCIPKEEHDEEARNSDIKSKEGTNGIKVHSHSVDADTKESILLYETSFGQFKQITYTYTDGNMAMTVVEYYTLSQSETVPNRVKMYGKCGNQYFTGIIRDLTERPDYEWITSFGLTPYVEKEVS